VIAANIVSYAVTGAAISVGAAIVGLALAAVAGAGAPAPLSAGLNGYAE
jgi:hypothetical protein